MIYLYLLSPEVIVFSCQPASIRSQPLQFNVEGLDSSGEVSYLLVFTSQQMM